jgi:hypothetical protein
MIRAPCSGRNGHDCRRPDQTHAHSPDNRDGQLRFRQPAHRQLHDHFHSHGLSNLNIPSIQVQANRTATVNATLKIGEVGQTITVEETPLINAVDTTNGYVMDKAEIDDVPLPTGSFTGLALLSPGVNEELPPAPERTPAWAISRSGPMASATPATRSC